MPRTRLTRRGKIVVGLLIAVVLYLLNDATIPSECKVPHDDLPQWCIGLLYS